MTADSVNPEYWLTPFCGAQDAYFPIETETAVATRNPENAEFFAVDLKNLGSGEEKIALELFVSDSSLAPGIRPRPDQTAEITLPAGFEGVVRLPFTPKKEAACYTLVCPPAPNIGWRGVSSPFYRWINRFRLFRRKTEGYEEIRISADCMGRSFFLNTDMARPVACAPSLVINGKNRSTENEGNALVSNPTDCLPQNLELRLDEPREIRQVQVTVDTDLCYPLYCFHSHPYYRETDEHVWTSPVNALKICETIRDACEEKAPQNAESYRENTARYAEELTRLDQDFRTVCETGKRKTLVFGDRFPFRYFAAEYGLTCFAAFPGCAAQTQVSASTLLFLTEKIRQEQLPVVLVLELSNGKIADTLCEETGAEKLLFHSCHNVTREEMAQGETYVSLMRRNLENLKVALN